MRQKPPQALPRGCHAMTKPRARRRKQRVAVTSAFDTRPRPFRSDHLIVGSGVPLTDAQWVWIEPLLPDQTPKRGPVAGPPRGDRCDRLEVPDRIAVGPPAREVRQLEGSYNRLRMWAVDGTWERVFTALMAQADADEDLNWAVSGGLHDLACAPARGRGPQKGAPVGEPHDHAIGRSRGGLITCRRSSSSAPSEIL
jgi:transposase